MRQTPRLFVDEPLSEGLAVAVDGPGAHYLAHVLRLGVGAPVLLFDDRTGEWEAGLAHIGKRQVMLSVGRQLRPREPVADLWLMAAPIRPERFALVVEKATELGVARICPVLTERTNHHRQRADRLRAHMIEAAEQCGRTALPELDEPATLAAHLDQWPAGRALGFLDESGGEPFASGLLPSPAALLIGPEGGFSAGERAAIRAHPEARALWLGPRILRADTAAVAAIALWQATDASGKPL